MINTRQVQLRERFNREAYVHDEVLGGRLAERTQAFADMPSWLVERLDRAGFIDASTGAGRQARSVKCRDCGGWVMRGLTAFPMAVSVDADPRPLSMTGEALCLLMRRPTYELRFLGNTYDLDSRDQWRRRERPAGAAKQVDVLAQHRCNDPPPGPYAATMLIEPEHLIPPDEPPY